MVCRGPGCDCCPVCGDHRYAFKDRRYLTCHPPSMDAPVVEKKEKPPTLIGGKLRPIKTNSRSRAPDARRREQLYAAQMGLAIGGDDDDINHA